MRQQQARESRNIFVDATTFKFEEKTLLVQHQSAQVAKRLIKAKQLLDSLFGCVNSLIIHHSQNYSICASKQAPVIVVKSFKEENYWPMAFFKNKKPVGGGYFCPEIFSANKQASKSPRSLSQQPIKVFVTGTCLFGDDLLALDQIGGSHPLTDPHYQLPAKTVLQEVKLVARIHPYESLCQSMLMNVIPMMKALAVNEQAIIHFHLPASEYLLYGLKLYLNQQMTKAAFMQYIEFVLQKQRMIKNFLANLQTLEEVKVEVASPLDSLQLEVIIADLLARDERPSEAKMLQLLIMGLCQHDALGVWALAFQAKPVNDLLSMNYLSYTVKLALAAAQYGDMQVCLIDMFDEKRIAREYAKYFAQQFGGILAMHWLPPVVLQDGKNHSLYFCAEARAALAKCVTPSRVLCTAGKIVSLLQSYEPELCADMPSQHKIRG